MNKFSKNLIGHIQKPTIKDMFFIWLLKLAYPKTSIIKDMSIQGNMTQIRAKNVLPIGDVYINVDYIELDPNNNVR